MKKKILLHISNDLLEKVEEYWKENPHLLYRNNALLELIKKGLEAEGENRTQ